MIPPHPEARGHGFRWVASDDQIEHLRNSILKKLVSLGTSDALSAVQKIAAELPDAPWLKYQALDARRAVDANSWKSRDASELIAAIALWSPPSDPRSTKAAATAAAMETESGALIASSLISGIEPDETIKLPSDPPAISLRRILLVATEWRSGHGGISTLNRELSLALAGLGHQVACLVLKADESEISEASSANVRLVTPPDAPGALPDDTSNLLRFYPAQLAPFEPEAVIGHDHITGLAGHHIARHIYRVPYVHFVHTLPEEIEKYKSRGSSKLRGGFKSGIQTDQCKLAQLVVAVGPRIHADFQSRLGWAGIRVIEIVPGLNRKLTKYTADLTKPRRSDCLLVARLEDPVLKGAPLACRIITELNTNWTWKPASKRPKLILRGFTEEKFESELAAIDGMDAAHEYVSYRPYTADEDHIATDICAASVVIMPSKMEGFGLTALEAIAAGIPTIMTSESGLGELLISQNISVVDSFVQEGVADVIGDTTAIATDWATRIADVLANAEKAFDNAAKLRSALMPLLTWERAARTLSTEFEALLSTQGS
jgi:glycosyltransferase involved in cell wall biosynthesis